MRKVLLGIILTVVTFGKTYAQSAEKYDLGEKFYLYWGWNRGWYSKSDVHMFGPDHDFVLHDAQAEDLQSDFSFKKYFYITSVSVPQTNIKLGYYVNDKYSFAIGFDHMKYRLVQNQDVNITGEISRPNSKYEGTYENESIVLADDFLRYNHTDGLNYVFGEVNRHDEWASFAKDKIKLSTETGLGIALLRPRTAVTFLSRRGPNVYHNAGYGFNGKVGVNLLFFKHFSLMTELKGGFINMPNIRATAEKQGQAEQHFWFLQSNLLIGATFGLWK